MTRFARWALPLFLAPLGASAQARTASAPQLPSPLLDNPYVTVTRNGLRCGRASELCRDRVIVALGEVQVRSGGAIRALERGQVAVFQAGESYEVPPAGAYYEIVLKPDHPAVDAARASGLDAGDPSALLYDGAGFSVYQEKLPVGAARARHGHAQAVVIQLTGTRLRQRPEGQRETTQTLVPDMASFVDPLVHETKNVGDQHVDEVVVELKPGPASHR